MSSRIRVRSAIRCSAASAGGTFEVQAATTPSNSAAVAKRVCRRFIATAPRVLRATATVLYEQRRPLLFGAGKSTDGREVHVLSSEPGGSAGAERGGKHAIRSLATECRGALSGI